MRKELIPNEADTIKSRQAAARPVLSGYQIATDAAPQLRLAAFTQPYLDTTGFPDGWKGVLFTIFIASLTGTLAGMILIFRRREGMKLAVPFGPFLAVGAIAYLFIGPETMHWYLRWMRP